MRVGTLVSVSALVLAAALASARNAYAQGAKVDPALADRGKKVWNSKQCSGCHELGRKQATGPDLVGVTDRRSAEWIKKWLMDPPAMAGEDSTAMALKKEYGNAQMPKLNINAEDANALVAFLAQQTAMKKN